MHCSQGGRLLQEKIGSIKRHSAFFADPTRDCLGRTSLDHPLTARVSSPEGLRYTQEAIGAIPGREGSSGRLQNTDISYSAKHPVLLPRSHPFTALIVCDAHHRVFHNGVKETLTEVRSKYWIVKGRSLTRAIIRRCTTCKRFEGAPINGPPPPLPDFRVREDPAFTYTGVDFACSERAFNQYS